MVIKYYIRYECNNCKTTFKKEVSKRAYDARIYDCTKEHGITTGPLTHNCFTGPNELGFAYPVRIFIIEEVE